MRKKVLLLALASMMMSLCIPAKAQQPQADSTVRLIDLTADMIANVKAYEPGPMKIGKNEYIIEIGSLSKKSKSNNNLISKKSKSDNKLNKDKTSRVPVGITVKELLSKLPGVEYAKDGKMITKTGKAVITDIVFDHTLVYSTDQIAVNNGDLKLKEGTVFLRIIDQEYYDNSHRVVLEDRNAPSPGTAFIRLTYYPGKDAGQVSGIEEIYPEWWEGILVEKVYDVNTGKQVITSMPEHHYTGMENGHGYVDLGLSTMWATCNVGADNPVEYGDYFAWGETEPYYKRGYARAKETKWKKGKERGYSWGSYSYCEGSESTMTKYCVSSNLGQVDNKHILEQADDAASVNWGGEWRMPSAAEVSELTNLDNTIWTWYGIGNSEFGGVAGFKVQSRKPGYTDNFIFLPAAGQYMGEEFSFAGFEASYWYNTLYGFEFCYSYSAGVFGLDEEPDNARGFTTREMGCSVRPVCRKTDVPTPEARPMPSGTDLTFTPNTPKVKPGAPMPVDIPGLDIVVDSNGIKHIMALPEDYYSNKENGYAYVDLGLSVKWATCNMGADEPYVAGDLYAWGETETKSEYTWENYKFYDGMEDGWKVQLSKYNLCRDLGRVDKRTVLQRSDDAAHVNLGGKWRLPTRDECNELIDNCTFVWASMNDVFGYIVISNKPGYTDRFIFLPINTTTDQGYGIIKMCSYYWSSNLNEAIMDVGDYPGSTEAYAMYILKLGEMYDVCKDQKIQRRYNLPVRPVCQRANEYKLPKGATKEEVMQKIPGLVIDDKGNATINGEPVSIISLDYSVKPQQSDASERTPLSQLSADLIEKVKAYDNYYYKLEKGEYVIEIEPISDETGEKPKYKEYPDGVKTSIIPVGTTVKELLSMLPDVETDKDGKLITKNGNEVVTSIVFDDQMLYPQNNNPIYTDDYKLEKGILHIQIIDLDYFKERSWSPLPGDPTQGTARIRINYHPGKDASFIIRHSPDDIRQSGKDDRQTKQDK